jgi:hypothetical protein
LDGEETGTLKKKRMWRRGEKATKNTHAGEEGASSFLSA